MSQRMFAGESQWRKQVLHSLSSTFFSGIKVIFSPKLHVFLSNPMRSIIWARFPNAFPSLSRRESSSNCIAAFAFQGNLTAMNRFLKGWWSIKKKKKKKGETEGKYEEFEEHIQWVISPLSMKESLQSQKKFAGNKSLVASWLFAWLIYNNDLTHK